MAKAYRLADRLGEVRLTEGYCRYRTLASYVHLDFGSNPDLAAVSWHIAKVSREPHDSTSSSPVNQQESFRRIEAVVDVDGLPAPEWSVVRRMIHASAEVELLSLRGFHPQAVAAGVAALRQRRPVFTDTRMLLAGVSSRLSRQGIAAQCLLDEPGVASLAREQGLTRLAVVVALAKAKLPAALWPLGTCSMVCWCCWRFCTREWPRRR